MVGQTVLERETKGAGGGLANHIAPHPVLDRYYTSSEDRSAFVRSLFTSSAHNYNRIEAVTSLGTGRWYRRKVLLEAGLKPGMRLLDVGCGTGLVAMPAARIVGSGGHVLGVDPNEGMRSVASAHGAFEVVEGVAGALPVDTGAFDMVTMGYALRHVDDLSAAFCEFARALTPGGTVVVLEITPPKSVPGRLAMKLIMCWIAPAVSVAVTFGSDAWHLMRYLWDTVDQCVPPDRVLAALENAGFKDVHRSVKVGVFSAYIGRKKLDDAVDSGRHGEGR